ncbi:leucyl aminopeptidase [Tumebacillus permanentifrigoris]|uniref:Probable cytosol aminopeptidase n=1 Tax=Tumebacillus permanentifrigoris TaxID=378543 RepID=A0A316DBL3_9BACL|nr:leucyl aminopeptidase [Tumebacillus permanentifrigoris]PWK14380.1 leucyl aminopeptidase [Tumebacillus permanentifrigoris]
MNLNLTIQLKPIVDVATDVLIVNLFEGMTTLSGDTGAVNEALGGQIAALLETGDFKGRHKELKVLYPFGKIQAKRIFLVGLGEAEEFTATRARQVAAVAAKSARDHKANTVTSVVHGAGTSHLDTALAAQALVEGTLMGLYQVKSLKQKQTESTLAEFIICEQDANNYQAIHDGLERGRILADATNFARDLINCPANLLTPVQLAQEATDIATRHGLGIQVLDEQALQGLGMNALLAIGQGSVEESRLIVINYHGNPDSEETLALVGKGITFDTGGYTLKPATGMENMKTDMGGAGAVLGAMAAIGQLKPKVNIMAVIPAAENMVSGNAIKPGDVIVTMNGKSMEIVNTDAEGRVVLADAITYALRHGATKLVDIATLTGAISVALGRQVAGLFSNDTDFSAIVKEAFHRSGERAWELPIIEDYSSAYQSNVADMKNAGSRDAGSIVAAMILREFVENTPWVHLDIAGVARDIDGSQDLNPRGATGFGVRTLVELAYLQE